MKVVSNTILNEQIKNSYTPAVKVQAQKYGHPAATTALKFQKFDWRDTSILGCDYACCASDGSLVVIEGTNVLRYVNPTTSTTHSTTAIPAAPVGYTQSITPLAIVANPSSAEVMIFGASYDSIAEGYAPYQVNDEYFVTWTTSSDYGVTWGAWEKSSYMLYGYAYGHSVYLNGIQFISPVYKSNGD